MSHWFLRQSTASQEVSFPAILSNTDLSAQTGLTIANTDIKITVAGATSEANKNSGGATHKAAGRYYCVLDATDTATLGSGRIDIAMANTIPVSIGFTVLPAMIYDSLIAGTDRLDTNVTHVADQSQTAGDLAALLATVSGYIDTEVAAIKAKTDNLPSDPADASDISGSFSSLASTLSTIAGYIDTEVAAIKAKTDNLPSDPADQSAVEAAITAAVSTLATASELAKVPKSDGVLALNNTANQAIADAVGGGSGLSGARTVVITVTDGTDPIVGAKVRLTDGVLGSEVVATNGSGQATFNVDDASWTVAITKPGYSFAGATLIVNGDETQTYAMTAAVITPSEPEGTTGYLTVRDAGVPVQGVQVQVQVLKFADGTTADAIGNPLASDTTDAGGYVEFVGLPRLATYQVRVNRTGRIGNWFKGVTLDAEETPLAAALGVAE